MNPLEQLPVAKREAGGLLDRQGTHSHRQPVRARRSPECKGVLFSSSGKGSRLVRVKSEPALKLDPREFYRLTIMQILSSRLEDSLREG
jgi:hypothetical protein